MRSLGAERSVDLFPPANWTGFDATAQAKVDYPGLRPAGSWCLSPSGDVHGLDVDGSRWRDRATGECVEIADRELILAYGSNADPTKLLEKDMLGGDSVVALRAAVVGWASVWCSERRNDGSVVATLLPLPGRVEVHPVLALTSRQVEKMDGVEGTPVRYRRSRHQDPVWLESGRLAEDVQVYLGTPEHRPALRVDGRPLLLADVEYRVVNRLVKPEP